MAASDPNAASHKRQRLMQTPYTGAEAVRRILENFGAINSAMTRFGETLYAIQNSASAIDNEFHALARNMKMTRGTLKTMGSQGSSFFSNPSETTSSSPDYAQKTQERLALYEEEQKVKKQIREKYNKQDNSAAERLNNYAQEQIGKKTIGSLLYGDKEKESEEEKISKYAEFLRRKEELYKTSLRRNRSLAMASYAMEQETRKNIRESISAFGSGDYEGGSGRRSRGSSAPPGSSYVKDFESSANQDPTKAAYVVLDLETAGPPGAKVGSDEYIKNAEITQVAMKYVNSLGQVLDTVEGFLDISSKVELPSAIGADGKDKFQASNEAWAAAPKRSAEDIAAEISSKNAQYLTPQTALAGKNIGPFDLRLFAENDGTGNTGTLGKSLGPLTGSKSPLHDVQDMFREIVNKENFLGGNKGTSETFEKMFANLGDEDLSSSTDLSKTFNIETMVSAFKQELDNLAAETKSAAIDMGNMHLGMEDVKAESLLYLLAIRKLKALDQQIFAQKNKEKASRSSPAASSAAPSSSPVSSGAVSLSALPEVLKVEIVKSIPLISALGSGGDSLTMNAPTIEDTLKNILNEGIKISDEKTETASTNESAEKIKKETEILSPEKLDAIQKVISAFVKPSESSKGATVATAPEAEMEIEKPSGAKPQMGSFMSALVKSVQYMTGNQFDESIQKIGEKVSGALQRGMEKIVKLQGVSQSLTGKDGEKKRRRLAQFQQQDVQNFQNTLDESLGIDQNFSDSGLSADMAEALEKEKQKKIYDQRKRPEFKNYITPEVLEQEKKFRFNDSPIIQDFLSKQQEKIENAYAFSFQSENFRNQAQTARMEGNHEKADELERIADNLFATASEILKEITKKFNLGILNAEAFKLEEDFSAFQGPPTPPISRVSDQEAEDLRNRYNSQPNPWQNIGDDSWRRHNSNAFVDQIPTVPFREQTDTRPALDDSPRMPPGVEITPVPSYMPVPEYPFLNSDPQKLTRDDRNIIPVDEGYVPPITGSREANYEDQRERRNPAYPDRIPFQEERNYPVPDDSPRMPPGVTPTALPPLPKPPVPEPAIPASPKSEVAKPTPSSSPLDLARLVKPTITEMTKPSNTSAPSLSPIETGSLVKDVIAETVQPKKVFKIEGTSYPFKDSGGPDTSKDGTKWTVMAEGESEEEVREGVPSNVIDVKITEINTEGFAKGGIPGIKKPKPKTKDPKDKHIIAVADGEGIVNADSIKNNEDAFNVLNTEGKRKKLEGFAEGGIPGRRRRNTRRSRAAAANSDSDSGGSESTSSAKKNTDQGPFSGFAKIFTDFVANSKIVNLGKSFVGLGQSATNLANNFAGLIKGSDPFNTLTGSFDLLSNSIGMQFIPVIMRTSGVVQQMAKDIENGNGFFGKLVNTISGFISGLSDGSLKILVSAGGIAIGLSLLKPIFSGLGYAATLVANAFGFLSRFGGILAQVFRAIMPAFRVIGTLFAALSTPVLAVIGAVLGLYYGLKKLLGWLASKEEAVSNRDKDTRETTEEKEFAEKVANRGGDDPKKRQEELAREKSMRINLIRDAEGRAAKADKSGDFQKGDIIRERLPKLRRELNALENQSLVERDPKQKAKRLQAIKERETGGKKDPKAADSSGNLAMSLRANKAQPSYSSIDEAYKKIQVSALGTDPLEIEKQRQQELMTQRMLEGMRGTTEAVNGVKGAIEAQRMK